MKQIDYSKRCFTGIMIEPHPAGKKFTCNIALTGIDELQIERFVAAYIGTDVEDLHISRFTLPNRKRMRIYHSEKALTDDVDSDKPWFDTISVIRDDMSVCTWIKGRAVITVDNDSESDDWENYIIHPRDERMISDLTITLDTEKDIGFDVELLLIPEIATDKKNNVDILMRECRKVIVMDGKIVKEEEEEKEEEEDMTQAVLSLLRRLLENE